MRVLEWAFAFCGEAVSREIIRAGNSFTIRLDGAHRIDDMFYAVMARLPRSIRQRMLRAYELGMDLYG